MKKILLLTLVMTSNVCAMEQPAKQKRITIKQLQAKAHDLTDEIQKFDERIIAIENSTLPERELLRIDFVAKKELHFSELEKVNLEVQRREKRVERRRNQDQEYKKAKAEYNRKYRQEYKNEIAERKRQYYLEHRDIIAQYDQQRYQKHKNERHESAKKRYYKRKAALAAASSSDAGTDEIPLIK